MTDLRAAREAYQDHEISDIGLVESADNPSDAFTKFGHNSALEHILPEGKCDFPVS